MSKTIEFSRRRVLQGAAGVAVAIPGRRGAAAQDTATPVPPSSPAVRVYPMPGTRTASPWTQISFRGAGLATLGPIQVDGFTSGVHPGVQVAHSDGNGVSWFPDFAFHPGEEVSVRSRLDIAGGEDGDFSFTCAVPLPPVAEPSRNGPADETEAHRFRSRPGIAPPRVETERYEGETAPGYVFIAPKRGPGRNGALIVDDSGEPIWFFPVETPIDQILDFRVMEYGGEPALVWWQGAVVIGSGFGHWVVRDSTYEEIATIQIANGYPGGDLHDIHFTPQNTAIIGAYSTIQWDLTAIEGGREEDAVIDNIIQEIDIATGAVIYEWHSLDFIALEDSYFTRPEDEPDRAYDHFHYNSIDVDDDGNLLICARNTWAAYTIDRVTGEVIWVLGGESSDFEMGEGTQPAFQHDVRPWPNGELTLFDNGAQPTVHEESRGLVLAVDMNAMAVSLVREYLHPEAISSGSQGNMQVLPNGNVLIGWGSEPLVSEFSADGTLLFDLRMEPEKESYRAYRFEWTGRPSEVPALAVERGSGETTVYASWNGATELAAWQVLAGELEDELEPVGEPAERSGFETTIVVESDDAFFAVQALDGEGAVLSTSAVVAVEG
jgi:hypothetical protein